MSLTQAELQTADLLADFFRSFAALPQTHPSDLGDVTFHIHALQAIVMLRCAQRCHADEFPAKKVSP